MNSSSFYIYYCEYRRHWVAIDKNDEPDDDGNWCGPIGEGDTPEEAQTDFTAKWENAR